MIKFSWYTIPKRITKLETVYQYAVDRFIPYRIDKRGFSSYIHIKKGTFVVNEDGGWTKYKPNMKGGHRHNHIYNVCNRITFRGKKIRRVKSDDKKYFVSIFWKNIALMPDELNKILAKSRRTKQ